MTREILPKLEFSIAGIVGFSLQMTVSLVSILLMEFVADSLAKPTMWSNAYLFQ